jgi:hypothetical protein
MGVAIAELSRLARSCQKCRTGDAATEKILHSMRNILTQLGEDVHALSYALHPPILHDLGLSEAQE